MSAGRSTSGELIMAGMQEAISSMISIIKLAEIITRLWNFTLKSYSRTDLTTLGWNKIAAEFKDTGKELQLYNILLYFVMHDLY
jgi:hypothetical protein